MKIRKTAAIYSVIIGISILGMWTVFLATGQVPQLETTPFAITFHIVAEFSTAILLLIGGLGLFANRTWGFKVHLASMGMLLYSAISEGLGYYVEKGETAMIAMFTIIAILTVLFIALNFKSEEFKPKQ